MPSTIIDYIVSLVIVTTLISSSIILTVENLKNVEFYEQDLLTSVGASDILNNLLQNRGNPVDWGHTNITPISFGLNSPFVDYMALSPFTPMRLMRADETINYEGIEYRNLTTAQAHLFLRSDEYVDYDVASESLAVDNEFGFRVSLTPILTLSFYQLEANPLKVEISLKGLSGSVVGALLNASLYRVVKDIPYPSISNPIEQHAVSDLSGSAELVFPTINADETLYIVLVKANLGGIQGVGYYTNSYSKNTPILPIVTRYGEGEVSLVHRKNITASYVYDGDVYYNLTFLNQVGEIGFRSVTLGSASGIINVSTPGVVGLSVGNPGILLVSSKTTGGYELTTMPWGMTPLCLSMSYGADPINKKTVVKKSQLTTINGLSYNIELAFWRTSFEN